MAAVELKHLLPAAAGSQAQRDQPASRRARDEIDAAGHAAAQQLLGRCDERRGERAAHAAAVEAQDAEGLVGGRLGHAEILKRSGCLRKRGGHGADAALVHRDPHHQRPLDPGELPVPVRWTIHPVVDDWHAAADGSGSCAARAASTAGLRRVT